MAGIDYVEWGGGGMDIEEWEEDDDLNVFPPAHLLADDNIGVEEIIGNHN
ncbi:hypothetical protein COLO4_12378 [Corchorus olitorius]|uniref:Uncharacterized protein n=1 Tax=Corchorus olitorius TaxID=93759 RepID=A0A1R3K122_9ROSI|nr:hypothetical protein COLO4_12378 [Corchorus olitorius]